VLLEYQRGISYRTLERHWLERMRKPWTEMRRDLDATKFTDPEIERRVRSYLELRADGFRSLGVAFAGIEDEAPNVFKYREAEAAVAAERELLDAALAKYGFAALPPLAPEPAVELSLPTDASPPGPAYLRAGKEVVLLDDAGFRTIAHDADWIGATPDGGLWICGLWFVARWDGTTLVTTKTKLYDTKCAVGPDGKLWLFQNDLYKKGKDVLASFDGKQWTQTTASLGDEFEGADLIAVDRDGRVWGTTGATTSNGGDGDVYVFEGGTWRLVPRKISMETHDVEELFLGDDGNMWLLQQVTADEHRYPDALSKITPSGVEEPVFVDDHRQTSAFAIHVDATGTPTILDLERDVVVQGKRELVLPYPAMRDGWQHDHIDQFEIDRAGRIWIDLANGLSVIDHGTHHVYPHGSIEGLREELAQIIVIGAGPKLPPPTRPTTRTITGKTAPLSDLVLCTTAGGGQPCAPALPKWETRSDDEGRFTFANVPRYRFGMGAHVGEPNAKRWKGLNAHCCADETELGNVKVNIYLY
jgi:hypothetical protein